MDVLQPALQPITGCSVGFFLGGGHKLSAVPGKEFTFRKLPQVDCRLHSNHLPCVQLMSVEPAGRGAGLGIREWVKANTYNKPNKRGNCLWLSSVRHGQSNKQVW